MGYLSKDLSTGINDKYSIDLEGIKRPLIRFWIDQDLLIEALVKIEAGFKVQPERWVVERTSAWLGRGHRLSKVYEFDTSSSESLIYLAMNRLSFPKENMLNLGLKTSS
jgi:putative transposase